MPIFEFSCLRCDAVFERLTAPDRSRAICECGGRARRILSGFAIRAPHSGSLDAANDNPGGRADPRLNAFCGLSRAGRARVSAALDGRLEQHDESIARTRESR